MPSVMGVLEVRESAVRVRVEKLRAEADRVLAELSDAEAVLERRVVALAELTEALAFGAVPEELVRPAPILAVVKEPVPGAVVPEWREGLAAGCSRRSTGGCWRCWRPAAGKDCGRKTSPPGWAWNWCRRRSRVSG